jgi:hypothetical protein
MATKRKRAKGGGRKPLAGPNKTVAVSMRVPPQLREELEAARGPRRARNRPSLTRVGVQLLSAGLKDRAQHADDPTRLLGYLIAETAKACRVFTGTERAGKRGGMILDLDTRRRSRVRVEKPGSIKQDWFTDPFTFRAFRLAVAQLLDWLEPKGEIISPVDRMGEDAFRNAPRAIVDSFRTPEARAQAAAEFVWTRLQTGFTEHELEFARNWEFGDHTLRMNLTMFAARHYFGEKKA